MFDYLEASARCEESELPKGEFVATYCKSYKKLMAIMSGIAIAIGGTLMFFWDVAILFFVLGICLLLLLPTDRFESALVPYLPDRAHMPPYRNAPPQHRHRGIAVP